MKNKNIYSFKELDFPNSTKEKFADIAFGSGDFRVEKIVSLPYSNGEWYDQLQDELLFLLDGSATLEFENGDFIEMKKGDYVFIKKRLRHRVAKTSENPHCHWLAVFAESILSKENDV